MKDYNKVDVQHVARYTDWPKTKLRDFLVMELYPQKRDWKQVFLIGSLVLSIGLFGLGIVFFFAYNWQDLHKFAKLSLIGALVVVPTCVVLFSRYSILIKQLSLTLACLMIGVFFAVFGQIYQTGANAYDFFLAWAVFSLLWVVANRFLPLWILYFFLLNTTLYFYFLQILPSIDFNIKTLCFLLLNAIPVVFDFVWLRTMGKKVHKIFSFIFSGITAGVSTLIWVYFIADSHVNNVSLSVVISLVLSLCFFVFLYKLLMFYRQIFYLVLLSISLLFIECTFFIRIFPSEIYLFFGVFMVIGHIALTIYLIKELQKKWNNESTT
jgi:uncharacterized membrane protein